MKVLKKILYLGAAVLLLAFAVGAVNCWSPGSGLHIVYIDYANNTDEVAVVFNASPAPIDLTDYVLKSQGNQQFIFRSSAVNPQTPSIGAFDVVRIHSPSCQHLQDPRDFNWVNKDGSCRHSNVWNDNGDKAQLFAPDGSLIAEYSYP